MSRKNEFTERVDKVIGRKIHELRLAKGLSRQQLAVKIGVTHQQLQKYELASNRITAGRLKAIADALGRNVQYFFDGIDSYIPPQNKRERIAIELSREFLKIRDDAIVDSIVFMVRNIARRH